MKSLTASSVLPVESELPRTLNPQLLHFFVLGPGLGESIVVRTPAGHWIVVDSHSTVSGGILPVHVLDRYGVEQIEILVLTHPDEDHYKGMADLCDWKNRHPRKVAAIGNLFDADLATREFSADLLPADAERASQRKGAAAV